MNGNESNNTFHGEFHILAFHRYTEHQLLLFIWVLLMYVASMVGNATIIILVCLEANLRTPMYFFLCNLSAQDIVYVSAILPKLLYITITSDTSIYFSCCITQMFLFAFCVGTEFFLLTCMSYDRYVAICLPLSYTLIMNKKVCIILATSSWFLGGLNSMMHSLIMANLSFCNGQEINHVFCDVKTLLKMSCSDTTNIQILIIVEGIFFGFLPFLLIITSYVYILCAILQIRHSAGRLKVFSSCSSHVTVVVLFSLTFLSVNLKPKSKHSQEQDKMLSLLYIVLIPLLNPLVYSLRNKDVLKALKKVIARNIPKVYIEAQ
ncbi:olfactory receptor 1019-like [Spea bombifrons]|uniref:olfactory receptor 1019-like n=1 Tax=Spea bombifrons TaxID=233779 RepID=UPI00234A0C76|nr:olfactory receptor 1019-like [Spea bombifrons]